MRPFDQLTNRGQAVRLRRLAQAALKQYDLEVRRIRLVTNDLNGIFRVDAAEGRAFMLRVSLPPPIGHSPQEVRSEMAWLDALRRETGLGVPQPLAARDGSLVTMGEQAGVPEPRVCAVFGWLPGPDLAERLSAENLLKLGELSAHLHAHAATFRPPPGFSIPRSDSVFPFAEPVVLFDAGHQALFPPERRAVYERALDRVQRTLDGLYAGEEKPRVLHNDLHQWNVKVYRGKLYALDFEDLMWGYPVQDIAITLYYLHFEKAAPAWIAAFREGYTRHAPWPERFPGEIDTYMAGRAINLANFILQDANPDYRRTAPEFVERVERRLRAFLARAE